MDGTMLDSEPVSESCWMKAAEELGYKIEKDLMNSFFGKNLVSIEKMLAEALGIGEKAADIVAGRQKYYSAYIRENAMPKKKGLIEILEYLKEKNVKQFEKKQQTYHCFLEKLGNIVIDLTQRSLGGNDAKSYENISSLENLIFQFGYLRIHMSDDAFIKVMAYTAEIFEVYRKQNLRSNYKKDIVEQNKSRSDQLNQGLYELTQVIAKKLFAISAILNSDMYGEKVNNRNNPQIEDITLQLLNSCGLGARSIA